ncbi:TIGR03936 family radical SAM-associated protein [Intestinibacillus massiliensis]|uniref:TIGR03936 family radical SAM-associated protein n=1 Tax=Intestinibacillus massiliensis TaxID=1871029 RepID=UPI000B3584E3|nr:TIGR03936 family radical SAM-associated protein [Intestinibacillus massiliensis]
MFKARMKFAKEGRAKYISHLDLMQAMQRAMARCQMPLWFTEGFNQHAYVSVALPLSTGFSGECEFLDFNLLSETVPEGAVGAVNSAFPEGLRAIEIYPLSDGGMKVAEIAYSRYLVTYRFAAGVPEDFAADVRALFERDTVEILKRSKRGEKLVNMRELMRGLTVETEGNTVKVNTVTAAGNNNLSPEYITKAIKQYLPQYKIEDAAYHRLCVYTEDMRPFR